jgi:hypothetical protein
MGGVIGQVGRIGPIWAIRLIPPLPAVGCLGYDAARFYYFVSGKTPSNVRS